MKALLTLSFLSLATAASAQITLNQSSYANWRAQTEIAYRIDTSKPHPALMPATNANWNLSTVTYDTSSMWYYDKGNFSNPALPSATFYDSLSYTVSGPLSYGVRQAGALTAGGFVFYGQSVTRQAFSIAPLSGGANDSMVFQQQNIIFTSPENRIKFPATMGSTWNSSFDFATNFNLTIAAFGLNNTPCQRKAHYTRNDAVVGWGKMIVKDSAGNPTMPMNVLMVKTAVTSTDSFFVGGLPAPVQLLTAFGLSQGQTTSRYTYEYYRAGELMPLVQATYRDSSFAANKMEYMDVHKNRLSPQSVSDLNSENGISAYPNPVRNQTIHLQVADKSLAQLNYQLININGQVMAKGSLTPQNGEAQLHAEALRTTGIYYLQLFKGNTPLGVLPLSVE